MGNEMREGGQAMMLVAARKVSRRLCMCVGRLVVWFRASREHLPPNTRHPSMLLPPHPHPHHHHSTIPQTPMLAPLILAICLGVSFASPSPPLPHPRLPASERDLPGTFLPFRELHKCPSLKRRPTPRRVDDVCVVLLFPLFFVFFLSPRPVYGGVASERGGCHPVYHLPCTPPVRPTLAACILEMGS